MIVTLAESLQSKLATKEFTYIFDWVNKYINTVSTKELICDYTSNKDLRNFMLGMIDANYAVTKSQEAAQDFCGRRVDIEDVIVNRWFYESGIDLER